MKKTEKIPVRMCCICREHKPKKELIRLFAKENILKIDTKQKVNTRGFYICNSPECLKNALKRKWFERTFKNVNCEDVLEILAANTAAENKEK